MAQPHFGQHFQMRFIGASSMNQVLFWVLAVGLAVPLAVWVFGLVFAPLMDALTWPVRRWMRT